MTEKRADELREGDTLRATYVYPDLKLVVPWRPRVAGLTIQRGRVRITFETGELLELRDHEQLEVVEEDLGG